MLFTAELQPVDCMESTVSADTDTERIGSRMGYPAFPCLVPCSIYHPLAWVLHFRGPSRSEEWRTFDYRCVLDAFDAG